MAMDITKFFQDLNTKTTWSAGIAFERSNALPLDKYSVFASRAEAENYVANSGVAYPGQVIAVQGETAGNFNVYYIDGNGSLQQVGKFTDGDELSVHLDENGKLSIYGFAEAEEGMQPVKDANGKIAWVKPSTTSMEGVSMSLASLNNRVDSAEDEIDAVQEDVEELKTKVGSLGNVMNFVGVVSDIITVNASNYEVGDVIIEKKVSGDNEVLTEYICSGVLFDGVYIDKYWESLGDPQGLATLEGKVSTLESWKSTADNTITSTAQSLQGLKQSVGMDGDTADATGSLYARIAKNAADIANKASQADLNTINQNVIKNASDITNLTTEIEGNKTSIANKVNISDYNSTVADINNRINDKADANNVYDKTTIDNKLAEGLGNKVNSSEYTAKISSIESSMAGYSNNIETLTTKVNKNTQDIAEINSKINDIATGSAITELTENVNTLRETVTSHTGSINTLEGNITTLNNNKADKSEVSGIDARLIAAEQLISKNSTDYGTLEGRVSTNEGEITALKDNINNNIIGTLNGLGTSVSAAQSDIETLKTTVNEYKASNDTAVEQAQTAANNAQTYAEGVAQDLADFEESAGSAHSALDNRISTLEGKIIDVAGAMHFKGVLQELPLETTSYENGDVIIVGDKEYVFTGKNETATGSFVEFGDVSAEGDRIAELENNLGTPANEEKEATGLFLTIDNVIKDVDKVEGKADALENNLNSLTSEVTNNKTNITNLTETLDSLTSTVIGNYDSIINLLNAETARAKAAEEANASSIADLINRVDSHDAALTWNKFTE